jgi:hypothetical protein
MTGTTSEVDKEALKSWYQGLLHTVTREMIKTGAINGTAVEARPVWISPFKILIAKVWDASEKSQFIWTISGEDVITDHIKGSLATTSREAARHFSLKWQGDADRLLHVATNKPSIENSELHMKAYTTKLIGYAESLYDLAARDDVWQQKPEA